MAVLNMVAANNWERPIYIDHSLVHTGKYFLQIGCSLKDWHIGFVPIKTPDKVYPWTYKFRYFVRKCDEQICLGKCKRPGYISG